MEDRRQEIVETRFIASLFEEKNGIIKGKVLQYEYMTQEKSIQLWQEGAKESLRVAHILLKEKSYALCLFHCHLASEKAMKGKYIAEKNTAPPKTHALDELAMILDIATPDTLEQYAELSDMAVQARYGDEGWGTTIATAEECKRWLQFTEEILQSSFL